MAITLQSFALDRWVEPSGGLVDISSAVDGQLVSGPEQRVILLQRLEGRPFDMREQIPRTAGREERVLLLGDLGDVHDLANWSIGRRKGRGVDQ